MKFLNFTLLRTVRDTFAGRYEPEHAHAFATLYWRSLLVTAFIILIASIVYGEWHLYRTLHGLGQAPTAGLPSSALERGDLEQAVHDIEARQALFGSF